MSKNLHQQYLKQQARGHAHQQSKTQQQALQQVRQRQYQERREYNTFHIDRQYEIFCRADESMPLYMKQNLETMPNNKGYIWKGIQYFGHQPCPQHADPDQWTLYEKRPGGDLWIHEIWYNKYHRIFCKKAQSKQLLHVPR